MKPIEPDTTTHDSISAETGKNDGVGTSGGCISRTQAIEPEAISRWKKEFREYVDSLDIARDDWKGIIEYIEELPSAQPFHIITMTDVMKYIDDIPEDVWQEFTARLECRGWELKRRTAKWCGGDFA